MDCKVKSQNSKCKSENSKDENSKSHREVDKSSPTPILHAICGTRVNLIMRIAYSELNLPSPLERGRG
jgi:hypothetical protein